MGYGKPRWIANRESRDRDRHLKHEAVRECRDGNYQNFRRIEDLGEITAYENYGVKPEEFRRWKEATSTK